MAEEIIVQAGEGRSYVQAAARRCGEDWQVCVTGGSKPHVGAVALGCAYLQEDSGKRSASVSVICATGHQDDIVARAAAKKLAAQLDCRVAVIAGLHIDAASHLEVQELVKNSEDVTERLGQAILSLDK